LRFAFTGKLKSESRLDFIEVSSMVKNSSKLV
jgi:hypothetical protein